MAKAKTKKKAAPKSAASKRSMSKPKKGKPINPEKLLDRGVAMKELFWEVVRGNKKADELDELEIRALIIRVGYLSDDERVRFASVLVRENLTDDDVDRYGKLQSIDRYFPVGKE